MAGLLSIGTKIVAVGRNYAAHAKELGNAVPKVVKADKKLLIVLFPDGRDGQTFTLKAETSEDLYEWKDALENALAQAPSGAAALDDTLAQTSGGSLLTGQSGGLLQDDAVDTIEGSFEQSTENQPIKSLAIARPILLTLEDDDGRPSVSWRKLLGLSNSMKDETVEFYREKFAGSQADRIVKAEAEAQKIAEQMKKTKVSSNVLSVSCDLLFSNLDLLFRMVSLQVK